MKGSKAWTTALLCAVLGACDGAAGERETTMIGGDGEPGAAAAPAPAAQGTAVRVEMRDSAGVSVGSAELSEGDVGVRLALRLSGLPPGEKGLHVHETGRCEPPAFESAGGHFNPRGRQHGTENPEGPHAGDLPNVRVDDDGRVDTTLVTDRLTLAPGQATSVVGAGGTALVLHAQPDDYRTDPSGESGDRIACGVIGGS